MSFFSRKVIAKISRKIKREVTIARKTKIVTRVVVAVATGNVELKTATRHKIVATSYCPERVKTATAHETTYTNKRFFFFSFGNKIPRPIKHNRGNNIHKIRKCRLCKLPVFEPVQIQQTERKIRKSRYVS